MTRFVIVTPVFNCASFVEQTLASVQAQTDDDWVHYLVDGGSTDGTLELLVRAAAEEPRRRLVTGRDRGMYDALFKGFEHAAADGFWDPNAICVWLNGDDLLMPWAFARLRQAFDETAAEWITALPAGWDKEGRLALVQPYNWYPRRLIRAGQFNGRSLGWIQQESTFFTCSLLSRLSDGTIETIRQNRLAGDFLLWREFSRHTRLVPIATAVAGFRYHGNNASATQLEQYFKEIEAAGVWVPPSWLGRLLRVCFRPLALLGSARTFRRNYEEFAGGV